VLEVADEKNSITWRDCKGVSNISRKNDNGHAKAIYQYQNFANRPSSHSKSLACDRAAKAEPGLQITSSLLITKQTARLTRASNVT
jgi:hypothetical protein